jgi:hypothetical protein
MLDTPAASELPNDPVQSREMVFSPMETPMDFSSAGALMTPGVRVPLQDTITSPMDEMANIQMPMEVGGMPDA